MKACLGTLSLHEWRPWPEARMALREEVGFVTRQNL